MRRMNGFRQTLFLLLLALSILLSGCGASSGTAVIPAKDTASEAGSALNLPPVVDVATVEEVRVRSDVVVIDVREDWEYAEGHIPGATLIPLGQLPNRLAEIPKDKTVVAVCRSGNRSGQATDFLRREGFDVHNMRGGMIAWEQAGLQVER